MSSPPTTRRAVLQRGSLVLLLGAQQIAYGAAIVAVRVWPAQDYSRVTIESDQALSTTQTFVANPPRLAVDIQGLQLNPALREMLAQVRPDDPNIAGIRVGQFAPNVVRLVLDLKRAAKPQVFTLKPIAAYQHRLVLDLYPAVETDPVAALLAERLKEVQAQQPVLPADAALDVPPQLPPQEVLDPIAELLARHGEQSAPTPPPEPVVEPPSVEDDKVLRPKRRAIPPTAAPETVIDDPIMQAAAGSKAMGASQERGGRLPPKRPAGKQPQAPTAPPATRRIIIVALDPGHGGEDPGAIGPGRTREKDVVLKIAQLLRTRINASSVNGNPMRAYLTRDADYFVPLATRVVKARNVKADLFISIHADAFTKPSARGASVFTLSDGAASSTTARWLANKENRADLIGGINIKMQPDRNLQKAIMDMSTAAQIKDSLKLGSAVLRQIGSMARLHKAEVERAGFAVLKAPDIPSVLIETAFISNPEEEKKLRSSAYQNQLADAIMRGIKQYFAANPSLARSDAA